MTITLMLALAMASPTEFAIPSTDGHTVRGVVDRAPTPARGAVIMVAGTGAFDRDVRLGTSGTERDLIFKDLAARFAERGLDAVRFDRRGVRYGVPPAEAIDPNVTATLTTEGFSRDVEAVDDWVRSPAGLNARCVVLFAHSEGMVHVAGMAERGGAAPDLLIGMGAPLESKLAAVRWQVAGRDAYSLRMMDADGDGQVTNEEVEANWMKTPSAVFGRMEPFIQPDGVWTAEEIAQVETVQSGLYEQAKAMALAQPDDAPYPSVAAPAFSYSWWKTWFTDDRPVATLLSGWSAPMILHYGALDSQVREDRQRAAANGVLPDDQIRWVSHESRGHSLGDHVLMGPIDEALANRLADEASAACGG